MKLHYAFRRTECNQVSIQTPLDVHRLGILNIRRRDHSTLRRCRQNPQEIPQILRH